MAVKRRARVDLHGADAEVLQILAVQSGDPRRIRKVLDARNPLSRSVLPHAIPLLEGRAVAGEVMRALEPIVETRSGALVDALLDTRYSRIVRRRLARVLSVSRSSSVADGLLMALHDEALDVRVQCARALFRIRRRQPELSIDTGSILDLVRTELTLGAPDLAHVFTLLAFVLPIRPLRVAYRSVRGTDPHARGRALEYLGGVLPKDVRAGLWAILE
jgi:hypothetical protein